MPIGDLLASITGEKPSTPAPLTSRPAPPLKRKADTPLPGSAAKTPRTSTSTNGIERPHSTGPSSTSRLPDKPLPISSTTNKSASVPPRPTDKPAISSTTKYGHNTPSRPGAAASSTNGIRPPISSTTARNPAAVNGGPKPEPPKKRSFAEIMARAQAAQAMAPKPGVIQHKPIERSQTKRERAEAKAMEARQTAKLARQGGAKPGSSTNGSNGAVKPMNGKPANGAGRKVVPPVEQKKVKKAALATTGYQGTARPTVSSARTNGPASRSGGAVARERERTRYTGALSSSRRREQEEEDELDDFIEYDDEEEEPAYGAGRRREYYSDEDESDMEAGLTDVEEEEERAAAIAAREDRLELERLARLKREKEERKRKLESARLRA